MTQKFQAKRKGTITQQTEFELEIPSFLSTDQEKLNYATAYLRANREGLEWTAIPHNSAWSEMAVDFAKSDTRRTIEEYCAHSHVEMAGLMYKCNGCDRVFETAGELVTAQQKGQSHGQA